MIDYSDASDLFYVWLKRALVRSWPELAITADPNGVQEKDVEIIVKKARHKQQRPPRPRALRHQDRARRSPRCDASFGAMASSRSSSDTANLRCGSVCSQRSRTPVSCMTGAWPAKTELGGQGRMRQHRDHADDGVSAGSSRSTSRPEGCRRSRDPGRDQAPLPRLGALGSGAGRHADGGCRSRDGGRRALQRGARLSAASPSTSTRSFRSPGRPFKRRWQWRSIIGRWRPSTRGRGSRCGGFACMAVSRKPKSELRWQALASSIDLERVRDLVPTATRASPSSTSTKFEARITRRLGGHRCCPRASSRLGAGTRARWATSWPRRRLRPTISFCGRRSSSSPTGFLTRTRLGRLPPSPAGASGNRVGGGERRRSGARRARTPRRRRPPDQAAVTKLTTC